MTSHAAPISRRRAALSLGLGAAMLGGLALAAPDSEAAVTRATIAGPSADVAIPGNDRVDVDVAPDGSAAIAFRQKVGGVDHAFVARYVGGAWSAPIRVDTGKATPSTRPVVAVGNGGSTLVVFPNGAAGLESLYASYAPNAGAAMSSPILVQGDTPGWKDVDLDVASNGNGYLTVYEGFHLWAFKVTGNTFAPVGGAYPSATGILNGDATQQAESGDQHGAHVAVDATGATATIAWGENAASGGGDQTLWARKLSGTAVGQVGAAVDGTVPTLDGKPAVKNIQDMPSVSVGGDGKAWVTWRAGFLYGAQNIGRALVRSFDGTAFGAPQVIDGLGSAPTESAEYPRVATNGSGAGLSVNYRQLTFGTESASLTAGGNWTTATAVSQGTNLTAGRASVALGDAGVGLISMYSPVTAGQEQALGRIIGGPAGGTLETLSDPAFGAAGLPAETGAGGGYAVTAFLQGTAATTRVVAAVVPLPAPAPPTTPGTGNANGGNGTTATGSAPILTKLRLRSKTLIGTSAAPKLVSTKSNKRTVSFTLDRAASVDLQVQRVRPGKLVSGGCVSAKGKAVPRKKRCTFEVPVRGTATLEAVAGANAIQFGGRATKGTRLAAGTYALYAVPRDQQATGEGVRMTFTLRAPR